MRKLREVLRLRYELKLGYQQIGRSCSIVSVRPTQVGTRTFRRIQRDARFFCRVVDLKEFNRRGGLG
jgi:hypothetical protein